MNYKFLSGITVSPSGKKAVFLAKQANRKKNSYDSWIYIVDFCTEEVRKLTSFGAEKNILFDDGYEESFLLKYVKGLKDLDDVEDLCDEVILADRGE